MNHGPGWPEELRADLGAVILADANFQGADFSAARNLAQKQMITALAAGSVRARTIWQNVEAHTTLRRPRPSLDLDELEFGSGDVCQLAQVTLRQLQWWDERKVVSLWQEGHRRVYHVSDVIGMMVIGELRRKGFSLQARRLAEFQVSAPASKRKRQASAQMKLF